MAEITPEQQALINQQIAAAQAANAAYLQAKESGTPIPVPQQNPYLTGQQPMVQPTMSTDVANTSKSQLWAESQQMAQYYQAVWAQQNPGQAYIGPSADTIMNQRLSTVGTTQRFLDIQSQYAVQHNAIVGSSGVLNPMNDGSGRYTYGSGYAAEIQGTQFQSNVLTLYQQQALQGAIQTPSMQSSQMEQMIGIRGMTHVDPTIISQNIAPMISNPKMAQEMGTFLSSPEYRKPYEDWFWGTDRFGYASARTPMDAMYIGRADSPFALPPGSASERFGFDEYGNVLGSGFPNRNVTGFNPKMGSGDYVYVGEYHYMETGETVSRYYERNVGSYIDVSPQGVFTEPRVMGVRSGGSPGSFRETAGYSEAMRAMPVDTGRTIFTTTQALGTGVTRVDTGFDINSAPRPFVSSPAEKSFREPEFHIFGAHIPVISDVGEFFTPGTEVRTTRSAITLPSETALVGVETTEIPGGTQTISTYQTTGGTQFTTETTSRPTTSAWDRINDMIRQRLPSADIGEGAAKFAGLGNVFVAPTILAGEVVKRGSTALFGADNWYTKAVSGNADIAYTMAPQSLAGQYTQFREQPLISAGSAALGFGIGAGFRMLGYGASALRGATATKVISGGGMWRSTEMVGSAVMKYGPKILGGLYAYDVTGRATKGFTDFSNESAMRFRGIMGQEVVPMSAGAIFGHAAPEILNNRMLKMSIGYHSALQEGKTTGRFDYYIKEPVTRPVRTVMNDYAAFVQERTILPRDAVDMGTRTFPRFDTATGKPMGTIEVPRAGTTPAVEGYKPGRLDYIVERTGLNRMPAPEPTTIWEPGTRTIEPNVNLKAYGKQGDIFQTGKIIEPEPASPASRWTGDTITVRTPRNAYTNVETTIPVEELAYGRQPSLSDRLYRVTMQGEQAEVPRTFFTEYTSNKLPAKAYPEAAEPLSMKAKAYLQEANLGERFTLWKQTTFYSAAKPEVARLNKIAQFDAKYNDVIAGKFNVREPGTPAGILQGTPPSAPSAPSTSRITSTKVVGGREIPALSKEPVGVRSGVDSGAGLKSMQEPKIGYRQDFRKGTPAAMKPFTKMSGDIGIMTEPLPAQEQQRRIPIAPIAGAMALAPVSAIMQVPMTRPAYQDVEQMQESRQRQRESVIGQIRTPTMGVSLLPRTRQIFVQESAIMSDVAQDNRQDIMARSDIMQASRSRLDSMQGIAPDLTFRQESRQDMRRTQEPVVSTVPKFDMRYMQDSRTELDIDVTQRQGIIQTQTPEQTITTIPDTRMPPPEYRYDYRFPDTPPPPTGGGLGFPGGGAADRGWNWRGERSWTKTNPVGADFLGQSRGSLPDFSMFGKRGGKKMKVMKFNMPRF